MTCLTSIGTFGMFTDVKMWRPSGVDVRGKVIYAADDNPRNVQ